MRTRRWRESHRGPSPKFNGTRDNLRDRAGGFILSTVGVVGRVAMAQRPVTLADIVRGHVSLEIEGFDRIYLNGWVPALQTSGQVAGWLHWRGFPIASPAALGQNAQAFRAAVRRYAEMNQIPWMVFRKGDRKLDVMRPYLEAAEMAGATK